MMKWGEMELDFKEYKKFFVKVFGFYYFDKVDEKIYGKKWKILCEEIIKMFIDYFEGIKLGLRD